MRRKRNGISAAHGESSLCSKTHYMGFSPQDPWVLFRNTSMIFLWGLMPQYRDHDQRKTEVLRAITHIEEEIGIVPLPGLMQFRIWFAEVPMLSVMNTVNVNCALHIWNTLWCQMLEDQGPGTSGRCSKFSRYSLPGLRTWAYQLENGTIPHQKIILFNPSKASCACLLFSFKWGSVGKCSASSSCLTGKRK